MISLQKRDFISLCLLRSGKAKGARTCVIFVVPLWLILEQFVQSSHTLVLAISKMRDVMRW